ncbi:extracellular catalytic domain type 2 short-chain-length polyhydroxyalkanoate depolymerase [Dichotomicrobium thermohalophilum]|uniref:Esterase/PHB depolymerase n=1 Tax=Dichotomicrobium thermohalophilum TaxID=933063 RepID=A0A397Q7V3_9HYPH|nr:PHB depolymerase family esterase [Dichotomicrobium thermohalophilum]RIA56569.1 esterase/PHB depolymerase [Dichotomicrobium thermohalophilum]
MAAKKRTVFWTAVVGLLAVIAAVVLWFVWGSGQEGTAQPLPALGADIERTTVSGLSSGAYMAGQFQVAHSDIVVGAGLVAGGPYGCAESEFSRLWPIWTTAIPHNLNLALNACMDDSLAMMGKPDIETLVERTRELAGDDKIAPVDGLSSDRVYLFHARDDQTVARSVVAKAAEYYREMGVSGANLRFVRFDRGAHAFITLDDGSECGVSGPPFLNDCDYDQAGAIIRHLYADAMEPGGPPAGVFRVFDQTRYIEGGDQHSMAREGVVYVPPSCRDGAGCAVHVAFHGCEQNRARIGDAFIRGSGFARWADANQLIVLFPQTRRSTVNPKACWDWWGYTGLNYRERSAPQIAAVRSMVGRLAQQP